MEFQIKPGSGFDMDGARAPVAPPPSRRSHDIGGPPPPTPMALRLTRHVLRGAAALLSLIAAVSMGTAAQTKRVVVVDDSGSPVTLAGTAKAHYSSALVYFIVINVLTLVYSVAILSMSASTKVCTGGQDLLLTIADLLTMIFLVSCNGAASAVSIVAENGNRHFGWDKICESVGRYCTQVAASIVLSMFATVAYVVLVLLTLVALHKRL